jgi:hypothetical protein
MLARSPLGILELLSAFRIPNQLRFDSCLANERGSLGQYRLGANFDVSQLQGLAKKTNLAVTKR